MSIVSAPLLLTPLTGTGRQHLVLVSEDRVDRPGSTPEVTFLSLHVLSSVTEGILEAWVFSGPR